MKGVRSPVEEVTMSGVISCGGDGISIFTCVQCQTYVTAYSHVCNMQYSKSGVWYEFHVKPMPDHKLITEIGH